MESCCCLEYKIDSELHTHTMINPEPFNDLSWNDDPLHSPNRTEYIEKLRARVKELEESVEHCGDWYSVRLERLSKLIRDEIPEPQKTRYFSIIANGTADVNEPPSYARTLNSLKHKLTALEKEVSDLRSALKLCITALNTAGHFSAINSETQKPYEFSESIAYATAIEFSKPLIIKSTPHDAK